MSRLPLQPGERELVRLRPGLGAFLPRFLGGLGLLAWGALVAWGPGMAGLPDVAVPLVAAAAPVLGGASLYLPRRRIVRFGLAMAAGAAVIAAPFVADASTSLRMACATVLAGCGLAALALTEIDRRLRAYTLTNLRILHRGGLWERKPWALHYDAVLDLDVRQTPFGRIFNHGTLDPILEEPKPMPVAKPTKRRKVAVPAMSRLEAAAPKPRMWGVRPLDKVRRLVEAFIQDATATEYLRAEQQTQKRVGRAMQDLGRANLLR